MTCYQMFRYQNVKYANYEKWNCIVGEKAKCDDKSGVVLAELLGKGIANINDDILINDNFLQLKLEILNLIQTQIFFQLP
jgi:hypothetical protein